MRHFLLLAVALGTATTSSSAAGPAWTFTALLTGAEGSPFVATGSGGRQDYHTPGGLRPFTGYTTLTTVSTLPPQTGNGRIVLGTAGASQFFWDSEITTREDGSTVAPVPSGVVDSQWAVEVTIYDTATGDFGTVRKLGTATSSDPFLGMPADLNLPDAGSVIDDKYELTIGRSKYWLTFAQERSNLRQENGGLAWDTLTVVADVQVAAIDTTGPALDSPEPATIALAGLGIAAAGLRAAGRYRVVSRT